MKEKIEKLIAEWEDVTIGTIATTAARTAAVVSASADIPAPVHEALARLAGAGSGKEMSESRARDIFVVVQYLRSLL